MGRGRGSEIQLFLCVLLAVASDVIQLWEWCQSSFLLAGINPFPKVRITVKETFLSKWMCCWKCTLCGTITLSFSFFLCCITWCVASNQALWWFELIAFFLCFFLLSQGTHCICEHVYPTCRLYLFVQFNNCWNIDLFSGKVRIKSFWSYWFILNLFFYSNYVNCLALNKPLHGGDVRMFTGWIRWENMPQCVYPPIPYWAVIVKVIWEPDAPRRSLLSSLQESMTDFLFNE